MVKKLKNILFWRPESLNKFDTPEDIQIKFILSYKNLIIGYLTLEKGEWTFLYSEEFKKQASLTPIPDFLNKEKEYKSKELWPFFASRIPSENNPEFKEVITKRNIQPKDMASLLELFGKRTITNPFILNVAG